MSERPDLETIPCEFVARGDHNDCASAGGGRGAKDAWCPRCYALALEANTVPREFSITQQATIVALEADRDRLREDRDERFDAGREAVLGEIVCSICGTNHDRDESAACDGCVPVRFDEWVERVAAEHRALQLARGALNERSEGA